MNSQRLTRVNLKLLDSIPRNTIRAYLGESSLSDIENFTAKGYTDSLYSDLAITDQATVIVLGGYLGDSVSRWRELFNCSVIVFEPIPKYANYLQKKFFGDTKVEVLKMAAGDRDCEIDFFVEGEKSGRFASSDESIKALQVNFSTFIKSRNLDSIYLEMNIEGGEYLVFDSIFNDGSIERFKTILVQFHRFGIDSEVLKSKIRKQLTSTHSEVFAFEWVWERWDLLRLA